MKLKVKDMCFIALMAAVLCIVAPLAVPIGPIPITLATFCVYLAGALLGGVKGTLAVAVYILLGAIGLPVFSGYAGGLAKLTGVTGGFIIGYIPCAAIIGFAVDRYGKSTLKIGKYNFSWIYPVSMIIGTIVLYALGTAWFMIASGSRFGAAMLACVIPFLPGDALKIVLATVLGVICRSRLCKMGILSEEKK